jgi:hypothetical protein
MEAIRFLKETFTLQEQKELDLKSTYRETETLIEFQLIRKTASYIGVK